MYGGIGIKKTIKNRQQNNVQNHYSVMSDRFALVFLDIMFYFYILKLKQFQSKEKLIYLTEKRNDNLYTKAFEIK